MLSFEPEINFILESNCLIAPPYGGPQKGSLKMYKSVNVVGLTESGKSHLLPEMHFS